jgi:hypothetical protein
MKKIHFLLLVFIFCFSKSYAQLFNVTNINKQVREYQEQYDFSTPLDAYLSFQYIQANGKQSMMRSVSSYKVQPFFSKNETDINISEGYRNELLSRTIKKVITYKDSVAAIVTTYRDSLYVFRYFNWENNQWVNGGEDAEEGLLATCKRIEANLPKRLVTLRKINEIMTLPVDTNAFVSYLEHYGKAPKQFILDALADYKIVIYGEIHRRRVSWQLMKELINDPSFYKIAGTVFMELSSDKQEALNQFFSNKELDTEIIFHIFREFQWDGWYDKGSYEFLVSLWELNKSLPEKDKIKVIACDIPMPLSSLKTSDDYQNFTRHNQDRNEQMADIIEQVIKTSPDKRHHLFIVGQAHVYKSPAIATEGEAASPNPALIRKHSAGYQLVDRFSDNDVFCMMSHSSGVNGKIRGGMFDYAFSCTGNKPVAFNLHDNPFGKEVFDAMPFAFKEETGSFENNYDGYIFLCPLEEEEEEYILYEVITDDFIKELKRRAGLMNAENEKWFGIENKNLTKESMILDLKNSAKNRKWQ